MAAPTSRATILIVSPHFGRESGGLGASTERISRNLLLHYNIVLLAIRRDLPPLEVVTDFEPGLQTVRLGAGDRVQLLPKVADLTAQLLREHRCSALIAFYISDVAYAASLAARASRTPWAVLGRGDDVDAEPFNDRGWMGLDALRQAQLVGAVSREMEAKLAGYGAGASVRYLPNGTDPVLFAQGDELPRGERPRIGLFGVIKPKKGLDLLLQSLEESECELMICGLLRDESARLLHGMVTLNPPLQEMITLRPFTRDETELVRLYHSVDVVVLPSHHEGMSNVMLESMACGRVVLCSAVGGALDVIQHGENGFLFAPGDRSGFLASLREALIASHDPTRRVGTAARERVVSKYSFREERSRYHRFVEELRSAKLP